jgi:hypothetical protein
MTALHQLAVKNPAVDFSDLVTATSFWLPNLLVEDSAWIEHGPFAFWLVDALRPRTIVELGCYSGFSYFAFCQAVHTLALDTQCHAVDTWRGDDHTGFYGEQVYAKVNAHNQAHYAAFSTLLRTEFNDASQYFPAGTIDLLHIDGMHTYEAVKGDFEHWRPRLSPRAVVLFHDINVRERGFGVARLWEELSAQFKSFAFLHGHGLGVLGVGDNVPAAIDGLLQVAAEPELAYKVRLAYSRLGKDIAHVREQAKIERMITEHETMQADVKKLETELARQIKMQNYLAAIASQRKAELESKERELENKQVELAAQSAERIATLTQERDHSRQQIASLLSSTSWRLTRPMRAASRLLARFKR